MEHRERRSSTAGWEPRTDDRLKRLTALKDAYDPTNFFRLNANIEPSTRSRKDDGR